MDNEVCLNIDAYFVCLIVVCIIKFVSFFVKYCDQSVVGDDSLLFCDMGSSVFIIGL